MPNKNNIYLNVKGQRYGGWTGISIEKSLYSMTGVFGLGATDIFPGNFEKWGIAMGDECTVSVNNQNIITGYIEDIPISYDSTSHDIQISGRDKTADLIDCSFTETAREWKSQTILKVIEDLCSPFSIEVKVDSSVTSQVNTKTPNDTFKANEGDVVFDLIFKLCRMKGIIPVSYGDGKLTLTGTGTQKAIDTLELGKNILSGNITQSNKDRFQTYIVKGQGKKTEKKSFRDTVSPFGQYTDTVILRHRPTVIFPETSCDIKYCQDRAKWECLNSAGNSRNIEYTVQGWTQSDGNVWPLNSLVKVKDKFLNINGTLLIAAVNFVVDEESGTVTRLIVVDPNAFILASNPIAIKTQADWRTKKVVQS